MTRSTGLQCRPPPRFPADFSTGIGSPVIIDSSTKRGAGPAANQPGSKNNGPGRRTVVQRNLVDRDNHDAASRNTCATRALATRRLIASEVRPFARARRPSQNGAAVAASSWAFTVLQAAGLA